MTKDQALKILQVHARQLREQGFDSVQLFVTGQSDVRVAMDPTLTLK